MHQTVQAAQGKQTDSEKKETFKIEKVIIKINKVLEMEANEQSLAKELSGNIEAIRENIEVMRACVRKEDFSGEGEVIRDQIVI
jgi:hypothetical protein